MDVAFSLDAMTRLVHHMRPLWVKAGDGETRLLSGKLESIQVTQPIFISGLARCGSTLILEYLATYKSVTTHQYRDFPFIFTPYLSRWFKHFFAPTLEMTRERAHKDGVLVSPRSPDELDEMLWRAFKKNPKKLAEFYRDHIKKLLLASKAMRYAAKNNHLSARLPQLLEMFPDARIIVPVRDPVSQIGSLVRQHEHFSANAAAAKRRQMKIQGQDMFGPARGKKGDEIGYWIEAWNTTYSAFIPYLEHPAFLFVPFEELCQSPRLWLYRIAAHAKLEPDEDKQEVFARGIALPNYYVSPLSDADKERIVALTRDVNRNFTKSAV